MSWKLAYKLTHDSDAVDGMVALNIGNPLTQIQASCDNLQDIQATANVGSAVEITAEAYDILGAYALLANSKADATAEIQQLDGSGYSAVTMENVLWTGLEIRGSANEIARATLTGYAVMDGASTSTSPITFAAGSGGAPNAVVYYKGITYASAICATEVTFRWEADLIVPDPCDNKLYPTALGRGPARCTVTVNGYSYGALNSLQNTLDASFGITFVDINAGTADMAVNVTNVRWGLLSYAQQHMQPGTVTLEGVGTTFSAA